MICRQSWIVGHWTSGLERAVSGPLSRLRRRTRARGGEERESFSAGACRAEATEWDFPKGMQMRLSSRWPRFGSLPYNTHLFPEPPHLRPSRPLPPFPSPSLPSPPARAHTQLPHGPHHRRLHPSHQATHRLPCYRSDDGL